jgi:hypothetical protein
VVEGERALTRQPMRTGRTALLVMLAVTALAFTLRLSGLDKLLPHIEEADPGLVWQERLMRTGTAPDPVAHKPYLAYPTLLARAVAYIPPPQVAADTPSAQLLEQHLAAASSDFVRVRTMIALLSSLLVPLTWWLARRLLEPVGALTASAFVALSLVHLLFSQQARPHGAHATVALAAVLAQIALLSKPSIARYAIAALLCALAVACLHTGVFTLAPLFVAWWLARRDGRRLPWWLNVAALVPCAAAVWCFYPRAPRMQDQGDTIEWGGHTLKLDKLDGSGFRTVATVLWDYDPALTVLAIVGVALAIARCVSARQFDRGPRDVGVVALAYALPYTLAIGVFGETVDRFLMPLVPYLALLAGYAVQRLVERVAPSFASNTARAAVSTLIAALALAFPGYVVARYVAVRNAPDTFEAAATWVRRNVAPNSTHVLLSPRMVLPLFHDDEALAFAQRDKTTSTQRAWMRYQLDHFTPASDASPLPPSERWKLFVTPTKVGVANDRDAARGVVDAVLDETRPQYVLFEDSRYIGNRPGAQVLHDIVRERGTLVETIRGEDADACQLAPIDYQEIPDLVPRLIHARCFGPCIEVYRMGKR